MILGCDISAWQDSNDTIGKVDFNKMRGEGAGFCFMRAMFGMMQDQDFADFWHAAKLASIARGAYYFPIVSQPIVEQTQKFIDILKADRGELPPVIDIEPYGGVPNAKQIKLAIGMIESQLGVKPIIYTGYYVWRDQIGNDPFFANYPLWIATYASAPMVPAPWGKWTFWQYTDKGDGLRYGVESKNIDMDYFNGTWDEFNKFMGTSLPQPEPPPEIARVRIGPNNVNLRSTPLLADNKVGIALANTEYDVIERNGEWVNVTGWIKLQHNGSILAEAI